MPSALVFGAGRMACGHLGHLLAKSEYSTLFIARRPEVIDAINHHEGYALLVAGEEMHRVEIRGCRALAVQDEDRVAQAVSEADVVFTALGIANLTAVAPVIARGLWQRSLARAETPLNVIACENLPGAGAYLGHQVLGTGAWEWTIGVEAIGGFSAALSQRIMTGESLENGEMTFTVDACPRLIIDRQGVKGAFPEVADATLTDEFPAMVVRKLFTLNCAHAVAAYLGHRHRCAYVHEAAVHPRLAPVIRGAVGEARAALKAEFPHSAESIDREADEALERIANPWLADPIRRVARQPLRKLSCRERLVGPARLAYRHGLPHGNLCLGIAAGLAYDDPEDPEAAALQQTILAEGLDAVLAEDCGILPHEDLARAVKREWLALAGHVPPNGFNGISLPWTPASIKDVLERLASELSQSYDSDLVNAVLARVEEEFQDARVLNYAPILMKRKASELLGAART